MRSTTRGAWLRSRYLRRALLSGGWAGYTFLTLVVALFLAWRILAAFDFFYPIWYELLDIGPHIAEYGPQNRYRDDFELTTQSERLRLFEALVAAIHQQGRGLESLNYHDPAGQPVATFLTPAEIVHLRDVARLIDMSMMVGSVGFFGWCLITAGLSWRRIPLPAISVLLFRVALTIAAAVLVILLLGPVPVFYRLHEWIFPAGHQWFFYYQDSLMTTLLKAPDVFAPIALLLLLTAIVLLTVLLLVGRKCTMSPTQK